MDDNSSSAMSYDEISLDTEISGGICVKGKRGEPKVKSGVFTIKRKNHEGRTKSVNLFNTADYRNTGLVNAVTGLPYYHDETRRKFTIGSEHEDSIFKVRFVTRENKIPGLVLCYDSPEQYENHIFCTVNQNIKSSWEDKNQSYHRRMSRRR
jgi:hypothetical protein